MRFLFVSTLYPSSVQPERATYSRSLMLAIRELGHEVRVIAPVPWCPVVDPLLRRRKLPPERESLDGIDVLHPRFLNIPGLLIWRNHLSYRRSVLPVLRETVREFAPDHVSIGFAFPDGAALLPVCLSAADRPQPYAQEAEQTRLRKTPEPQAPSSEPRSPACSLQVLGSDFRQRTQQPRFRRIVMDTIRSAPLIFCPGQALKRDMAAAGIAEDKIVPFNNGVEHDLFRPASAREIREKTWNRTVLFVGNLVHVKGVDRLLRAWALVKHGTRSGEDKTAAGHQVCGSAEARERADTEPIKHRESVGAEARLRIIGGGPLEHKLKKLSRELGVDGSVEFLGRKPHDELPRYMREAHCLCLPSRSEGMPNVVLEALACGTPVVATAVGEVPYLVENGKTGFVAAHGKHENTRNWEERLIARLAEHIVKSLSAQWDSAEISDTVDSYTWERAAERVCCSAGRFSTQFARTPASGNGQN